MKYVIWDWNGTLIDDLALAVTVINRLMADNGYPQRFTTDEYKEVFGFPVVDYYRRAGFDLKKHSFDFLAQQYVDLYNPSSFDCPLCEGAAAALQAIRAAGCTQVILSASEDAILAQQVAHYGLTGYFDALLGQADSYAHGKLTRGRQWMADSAIDPEKAVLVGDTLHDAQVAADLGISCVLCAKGHQSRARLESAGVPVIDSLLELPALLGM